MASQPERAYTCTISSRKDTSFLRSPHSEWSKIDTIGQTILLAELTAHFGSFQNTCVALKLRSNEVESFLLTHLQYQRAHEQGALVAAQWGRDQVISANEGDDIPQQRPILVCASSITPACDFLDAMGYQCHIPAVRAWIRRTITWPPDIDVADLDTSTLDKSDVDFPTPRKQREYSRYTGSLGNDTRAVVALVGAWRPKEDGTPDTRISFIDVPNGTVVYGPHGARRLVSAGRYYVCWPTDSLLDNQYNDFVLARNAFDNQEDSCIEGNPTNLKDHRSANADIESSLSSLGRRREGALGALKYDQSPSMAHSTLHTDSSVNPKGIFSPGMPDAHGLTNTGRGPFHPQDEAQGPSRKLANLQLQQTWDNWPGQLFQFRLPSGHTILDPKGNLLTFDPPQSERYDELGNPRGIGGTYFIVPPCEASDLASFQLDDLPANVALRFKVLERLVIIRNGMVLPRFVEPGVHEWSTREGFLDLYNANGCYDVLQTEGGYSVLPDVVGNAIDQDARHVPEQHYEGNNGLSYERAPMGLSPIEEASQILAPYKRWLDNQEAEEKRLDQDSARFEVRRPRDEAKRDILKQEVQERAASDAILPGNTAAPQAGQNRSGRKKHNVKDPFNTKTPKVPRRKRIDSDDEEYVPTGSRSSRAKKPKSTPKTPTTRKSQQKRANDIHDIDESPSPSVLKSRRNRAQVSKVKKERREPSSATRTMAHQSPAALDGSCESRPAAADRKPIGPLLEAIWADRSPEKGASATLQLPAVPK